MPPDAHTGARSGHRELLRTVAEGTAGAVGGAFLRELVRHVALAFDAKFAFVAEATDPTGEYVRVVSGWYDGDWMREHLGHMAVMDAGRMAARDEDVAAMRIFASRAAAELERRRQAAALRRSRSRVIEAADSERRRVGRDLHDGAQQRLVAVANLLKLAQRQMGPDDEAVDVLRLASDELSAAQTELRDLARGLHPVALSERGLQSALESLMVGCEVPVMLDVAVDELPDDVELAAYFIVCEALTNARKYADAREVRIRVAREADALLAEIVDDGSGGADPSSGTGLRGLADRVDALGGRLEVESPPGAGTRVRAHLPVRPLG